MASKITSFTSVYSAVYSGADNRKPQSFASLAFVWGIHRWPVNSPHKWPVTRKMFAFDYVVMLQYCSDFELPTSNAWFAGCGLEFGENEWENEYDMLQVQPRLNIMLIVVIYVLMKNQIYIPQTTLSHHTSCFHYSIAWMGACVYSVRICFVCVSCASAYMFL